jgi:hypothetical protein
MPMDLSATKIYGDIDELQYPEALKSNTDPYAQIPIEAITLFRDQIKSLQFSTEELANAQELDSMIVGPNKIQSTASKFKAYFWQGASDYYQVSEVDEVYYFDYLHNCCHWATEVDNAWQLKDMSQGFMRGRYWSTDIDYSWKKNDKEIFFIYYDYGYYPWEGIRYQVTLNRKKLSGSVIQSHYDGWSVEVTWDSSGKGNWVHTYEDEGKASGSF